MDWTADGSNVTDAEAATERARLVRLCARVSGCADAAEDLAQETLLEAWRNGQKLLDPRGRDRWLAAIARNVCKRWARGRGRELPRLATADEGELAADDLDLEVELERHELAQLLDRAMALLPAETRDVLVRRYVHESPHAEIAERLGVSEDAVSMRLSRGKLVLRRLLSSALRDEAEAYGLYDVAADGWRETRVWCPDCGRRRLTARFQPAPGAVSFRCPACSPDPGTAGWEFRLSNAHFARLIGGSTRPRLVLGRTAEWAGEYFGGGLGAVAACTHCSRPVRLGRFEYADAGERAWRGLQVVCDACGEGVSTSLRGLALSLPEVRRFRREHPRIRALPEREVEADGQAAVVSSYESLSGSETVHVVVARDTFRVLAVHAPHNSGRA